MIYKPDTCLDCMVEKVGTNLFSYFIF